MSNTYIKHRNPNAISDLHKKCVTIEVTLILDPVPGTWHTPETFVNHLMGVGYVKDVYVPVKPLEGQHEAPVVDTFEDHTPDPKEAYVQKLGEDTYVWYDETGAASGAASTEAEAYRQFNEYVGKMNQADHQPEPKPRRQPQLLEVSELFKFNDYWETHGPTREVRLTMTMGEYLKARQEVFEVWKTLNAE